MSGASAEKQEPTSVTCKSFVGREREMQELRRAFGDAGGGHGRVVLLTGDPGIGKTRVLEEFAGRAQAMGAQVLWGRCHEGPGAPPLWPWVQIIRRHIERCEAKTLTADLGGGAAVVAEVIPEIHERVAALQPPPPLERDHDRFRLFDCISVFLATAARRQPPLVVMLDDVQWADASSVLLLLFVARSVADTAMLIVGAVRDSDLDRHHPLFQPLGELSREPITQRLALTGLNAAEIASYVESSVGQTPSAALVSALEQQTEGNPFFIGEIVRLLVAEGRFHQADTVGARQRHIPQGVRAVITRRLDRFPAACTEILRIASVIGREFSLHILSRIRNSAPVQSPASESAAGAVLPAALAQTLEPAVVARVVMEVPNRVGEYVFAHALVRDTLYGELSALSRARLHRRVAQAIEDLGAAYVDTHLSQLACHCFEAVEDGPTAEKAINYAIAAARRAMQHLSYEEAADQYARALQGLDRLAALGGALPAEIDAQRCEVLLARAEVLARTGDSAGERAACHEAAALAKRLGLHQQVARAALGSGWLFATGRADAQRIDLLQTALELIGPDDGILRARVMARLALALHAAAPPHEAVSRLAESAVEMARRLGDRATLAFTLNARQYIWWVAGKTQARLGGARELLALAEAVSDQELALLSYQWLVMDLLELGERSAAERMIANHARVAAQLRHPLYKWSAGTLKAMRALLDGQFAEAERLAGEALMTGLGAEREHAESSYGGFLVFLRREQGRLSEFVDLVAASAQAERELLPGWLCGLALIYAELGRAVQVRDVLGQLTPEDIIRWPLGSGLSSATSVAEAAAFVGDGDFAARLYDQLLPFKHLNVVIGMGTICCGSVSRSLGLLATTLRRWQAAESHFVDALAMNRQLNSPPLTARTQVDYAGMLVLRDAPGDRQRARDLLVLATEIARRLGMTAVLAKAEQLSARLQSASAGDTGSPSTPAAAPPATGAALLRQEGDYWTIAFESATVRLKDSKGLHYLAHLLRHPGQEVHALDMVMHVSGSGPAAALGDQRRQASSYLPQLDPQARAAYKRRLADLREGLREAEQFNDAGRAAAVREEMEFIIHELSAAVGLGGRDRKTGSPAERARLLVTQRLKATLTKIRDCHPALGRHFAASIKTGYFCMYAPAPQHPIRWLVGLLITIACDALVDGAAGGWLALADW